ncbi:Flp family type IVb pilin [Variovorax sp. WS11]|uniref:Flp family type IVb pilin n=1 Tax=Variovorax sp. WS11 TaxID=1105204 RepID=UPI000D0D9BB9|nr:Flp family type IVb pilin [Variovorax sp. WS11]NDZ15970.1 Flp family type IVb pilin [Variovorax sp. WS11]PSL81413.1 Flp family type IVb pilin [Variovorax sp. WS11]
MKSIGNFFRGLAIEEDGAQIIEYALIVAVVSLGLILLVQTGLLANGGAFTTWLANVGTCLTTGTCPPAGG